MGGIAVIWGKADKKATKRMLDALKHRGGYGESFRSLKGLGSVAQVHNTPAAAKAAEQLVENKQQNTLMVADGAIFNYDRLRRQLGCHAEFVTDHNSEVILRAFEHLGVMTPRKLDGAFAFAAVKDNRLLVARDKLGVKPLYYAETSHAGKPLMYFASELKALTPLCDEIHEFPPGTYYDSAHGFRTYYMPPQRATLDLSLENHIRRLRETVETAVQKQLLDDIPAGVLLTGSVASGIVAALAKQSASTLHTFSAGMQDSPDMKAARQIASHIGSLHHEYVYTMKQVVADLPEIVYYLESFDQDLVRAAITLFYAARMAAGQVQTLICDEGADELFAGHRAHIKAADVHGLEEQLYTGLNKMHNIQLQCVDRMTGRHGLEARLPYLDMDTVELSMGIPAQWKLRAGDGGHINKWILRKTFADLLPADIVWRDDDVKIPRGESADHLSRALAKAANGMDTEAYRSEHGCNQLRSAEECLYHCMLLRRFQHPEAVFANVGRWR